MAAHETRLRFDASAAHMERAARSIPRGTSSTARLRSLAPTTVLAHGDGCRVVDVDGNELVDWYLSYGPLFLGHRPRPVLDAVGRFLEEGGILSGGPQPLEAELAEAFLPCVPGAERVLFPVGGSEAIAIAIRIARATTGRRLVVKFDGHYHGWTDTVYVNAPGHAPQTGPVPLPLLPNVPGAPAPVDVVVVPYNDEAALAALMAARGDEVACILVEPIPFNFGSYLPDPAYLAATRALCDRHGALLVFDEVIAGFRLAPGSCQALLSDVRPDLWVFAKAIASGFPLAAVAGTQRALASAIDGAIRQGGTYNANGVGLAAALATVRHLTAHADDIYPRLDGYGARLADAVAEAAARHGLPLSTSRVGSMVQLLWQARQPVRSYADALTCDQGPVLRLATLLLERGCLVPERGLLFMSAAHDDAAIEHTVASIHDAVGVLAREA